VSRRFECDFWSGLHFADVGTRVQLLIKQSRWVNIIEGCLVADICG